MKWINSVFIVQQGTNAYPHQQWNYSFWLCTLWAIGTIWLKESGHIFVHICSLYFFKYLNDSPSHDISIIAPVLIFFNSYFIISLTLACTVTTVLRWDTREDTVLACTSQRKCWSAPMTAESVGVNRGSLNPINLPVIQLWQVSQIIQHKGQNKWVLLRQAAYCSLYPWQSQNKWPQAYRSNRFTLSI